MKLISANLPAQLDYEGLVVRDAALVLATP